MDWLANYRAELRRAIAAIGRIDGKKLALDIAARRLDRALARNYARNRLRLNEELDAIGVSEAKWCQTLGRGNSLSQMRRRLQFQKPGAWQRYLTHRREKGDNGVYGLEYAVFLAKEKDGNGTSARPTRVQSANKTLDPDKVNLITGDGVEEMSKMPPELVNVIIKSPPYWPARRIFDPDGKPTGIGFEPTFEEYLHNLVHKFGRAEKRVLRDDGVLCVVLDDAIAQPPTYYGVQNYNRNRAPAKLASQTGFRTQDSTYLRPKGNWLLLPFRLALAMQDDGWYLRDIIIIDKGARGGRSRHPTVHDIPSIPIHVHQNRRWILLRPGRTTCPARSCDPWRHPRLPHVEQSAGARLRRGLACSAGLPRRPCRNFFRRTRTSLSAAHVPTKRPCA